VAAAAAVAVVVIGALSLCSGEKGFVSRGGVRFELPPPCRKVALDDGRPPAVIHRISEPDDLEVFFVKDVIPHSELNTLVKLADARNGFQGSWQKDPSTGELKKDDHRTSSSCPLLWPLMYKEAKRKAGAHQSPPEEAEAECRAVEEFVSRCAEIIGVDPLCIEPLQLVKYLPGEHYRSHFDGHREGRQGSYAGEQRMYTLLVFANDVPASDGGGYLHFPRLGLKILPQAGCGVLWRNTATTPDGHEELDPRSLHEGEAPLAAEKIAVNVWAADTPFSVESVQQWQARQAQLQANKAMQQQDEQPTSVIHLD